MLLGNDLKGPNVKPLLFLLSEEGSTEGNTWWEMGEVLATALIP